MLQQRIDHLNELISQIEKNQQSVHHSAPLILNTATNSTLDALDDVVMHLTSLQKDITPLHTFNDSEEIQKSITKAQLRIENRINRANLKLKDINSKLYQYAESGDSLTEHAYHAMDYWRARRSVLVDAFVFLQAIEAYYDELNQ